MNSPTTNHIQMTLPSMRMVIPNKSVFRTVEYNLVVDWYGERTAKRSGVPLINHIHEGLVVLNAIGASIATQSAFCLHPLLQHDDDFYRTVELLAHNKGINPLALILAVEYRSVANEFLSSKIVPGEDAEAAAKRIRLSPLPAVSEMLIADKVQNRKDFFAYHRATHPRSNELDVYFKAWLKRLEVSDGAYSLLCGLIDCYKSNLPTTNKS